MRFPSVPAIGALLFVVTLITAAPLNDAAAILQNLQKQVEANLGLTNKPAPGAQPGHGGKTCTLANAAVRKDWYPLSSLCPLGILHCLETQYLIATVLLFAGHAGWARASHRLLP